MFDSLLTTIRRLEAVAIPAPRTALLDSLAAELVTGPRATFVCTHNSRRSQLAQAWAWAAAAHHDLADAAFFSGGTEVTRFHPSAIAALERAGFAIDDPGGDNPRVRLRCREGASMEAFSKHYDDAVNPRDDFVAIMTCAEADAACPVVVGARARVPLRYDDPKVADGRHDEATVYDACSDRIGAEILSLMARVANTLRAS